MKKIIIIFIIAFCLLSFMEISYSNEKNLKYGDLWNSFSNIQKSTYLLGIHHGIMKGISECIDDYCSYFSEKKRGLNYEKEKLELMAIIGLGSLHKYLEFSSLFDLEIVSNVVTDLYKDPANTYIFIADIYFITLRKLKGENIESSLRELREKALL